MKTILKHLHTLLITLALFTIGCQPSNEKALSAFGVFCEMVANDAKPIALNEPMTTEELDLVWEDYQSKAATYNVSLFREKDFPVTSLFPASVTEGKEVVIIYQGSRLIQYEQFKRDQDRLTPESAARRFGRLLGYTPQGINNLLMKNTPYKTLESFGVEHQITHLYYEDVEKAKRFYGQVLGLKFIENLEYSISQDASLQLHAASELHPQDQAKSTAIALLTDQLPEWYAHLQQQQERSKTTYEEYG